MGEEAARNYRMFLESLPQLKIIDITATHHRRTIKVLERYRGTKLTYADASSLSILEQKKISTVWSTDHHLGLTGATVVPRL
jgi:predicted nucleic acid-binding protein